MCQGFSHFAGFLHHFVLVKLAINSIRVKIADDAGVSNCCIVALGCGRDFNPFTLRVPLESIFCYSHTFENNWRIKYKFTKHLKESSCLASNEHFSFKYFSKFAFIRKILSTS